MSNAHNGAGGTHGKASAVQQIAAQQAEKARAAKIASIRSDLDAEMSRVRPRMTVIDLLKFELRTLGAR